MDFYYLPSSAPCRSVIMVAKVLGIDLNKILLHFQADEQLKPEFVKINPQHVIPTLVEHGFALLATVSTFDVAGFDFSKYPNVVKWYAHAKKVTPGADKNWEGCLEFKKFFD